MYKLLIEDWETDETVEVQSPAIPVFRQTVTFYDKNGQMLSRVVRFVDYVFDTNGEFKHILLSVEDEVEDTLE